VLRPRLLRVTGPGTVVSNPIEMVSTRDQRCVTLRRAVQADRERVAVLLRELELPTDGVAEWLDQFWIGEHEGAVVGVAGMERYGAAGLLRSVAVAPEWRGSGIGRALVDRVLEEGRAAGVQEVFLLTTTAEHYFPRLGFACVGRERVPDSVRTSAEFTGACPASAVVMRKAVAEES
jgi:amino-acid N-acetyltransferase